MEKMLVRVIMEFCFAALRIFTRNGNTQVIKNIKKVSWCRDSRTAKYNKVEMIVQNASVHNPHTLYRHLLCTINKY